MITPFELGISIDSPLVKQPGLVPLVDPGEYVINSPLAQDLSDRECEILASAMYSCRLEKDDVLLHQGQVDDTLHLVVSGRLAVTKHTGGEAITLHVMGPGSLAGEMGFVDRLPHTVSLVALEPVTVLCLRRESFEQLLPTHPELVYRVMRAIVRLEHATLGRMNLHFVEMHNYITQSHGRY